MSFLQSVAVAFVRCSAKLLGKAAAKAVVGDAGPGASRAVSLSVDALFEFAGEVWERWSASTPRDADRRGELARLAALDDKAAAAEAGRAVAELPPEDRDAAREYLAQLPAAVRRTFRRPTDPAGRTADPNLPLSRPADLLPLLPAGLPRFRPGDRAPGMADWVLLERLGVGGFGEVWRAGNPHLPGEDRALKFVTDPAAARSLRNEAKLLARIRREGVHPGIVRLLDTSLSADPPCVAYEFVGGGELTGLLRECHAPGRPPPTAEAVATVVRRLADTVAAVHRLDPPVVHRDLKPANVLLRPDGRGGWDYLVADFGIGGIAAEREARFRTTSRVSGFSQVYSSPQQIAGSPPDPRDDVYGLGMIWLHLLTGDTALSGPPGKATRQRLRERGLTDAALELLCDCVSPDLSDRPADAGEMVRRLDAVAGARRTEPVAPPPVAPQAPVRPVAPAAPARASGAGAVVGAAVLALIAVAVTAFVVWRFRPDAPATPPPLARSGAMISGGPGPGPEPVVPPPDPGKAEPDDAQVAARLRAAAERGDPAAQLQLGRMYRDGRGVPADAVQAAAWVRKAADQGNAEAQSLLGSMYQFGQGVPHDHVLAVSWTRAAAEQGNAEAQMSLGSMYAYGVGVPKDNAQFVAWYQKAAEGGNAFAQSQLGFVYERGEVAPKDDARAAQWYLKAAEQGRDDAQFALARMYAEGRGVPKDDARSADWLRRSAERGHILAQYELGLRYAEGRGVSKDEQRAVEWFAKAAARGHSAAKSELARRGRS